LISKPKKAFLHQNQSSFDYQPKTPTKQSFFIKNQKQPPKNQKPTKQSKEIKPNLIKRL
jgi:hypothetical protein